MRKIRESLIYQSGILIIFVLDCLFSPNSSIDFYEKYASLKAKKIKSSKVEVEN